MKQQNKRSSQKRTAELCHACTSTIDQILRLHEMLNQMTVALNSETAKNTYLQQTIKNTISHYQNLVINDNILNRAMEMENEMKRLSLNYENETRQLKEELKTNKDIVEKLTSAGLELYNKYAKLRSLYNDALQQNRKLLCTLNKCNTKTSPGWAVDNGSSITGRQ